jgi:hypothetical protein
MAAGVVSFADSMRIRSAVGELLLASAHSVLQPRPHYPQLSLSAAKELFNQCYEGPFERSSFVASVVVPVPPVIGGDPDSDPYPRKVTQLLIHALHRASNVAESGHPEDLLQLVDDGMRELPRGVGRVVATDQPGGRGCLELMVAAAPGAAGRDFACAHPCRELPAVRRGRPGPPRAAYEARRGADRICHVRGPQRQRCHPFGQGDRGVRARGVSRTAKVQMTLPAELYQIAVDAHARAGMVRAIGVLRREPRSWMLDSVSLFEAVSAEDP